MREVSREVRQENGRIEVWRRGEDESWFATVLPDPGEDGYPGHTYSRQSDEIPTKRPAQP